MSDSDNHVLARLWPGILGVTSCCMQHVLCFTRWRHHGVSQRESASEGQTDESEWTREWDRNKSIKKREKKRLFPQNVYFKRTYCSSGHFGKDVFIQVWFGWLSTVSYSGQSCRQWDCTTVWLWDNGLKMKTRVFITFWMRCVLTMVDYRLSWICLYQFQPEFGMSKFYKCKKYNMKMH